MDNNDYNGWTNRATWSVYSWLGNDSDIYQMALSLNMVDASQFENFCRYLWKNETPDGCSLAEVDWQEIADAWTIK